MIREHHFGTGPRSRAEAFDEGIACVRGWR